MARFKKIWGRTTVRGHTNWWKTWPLWNRGKWLLSKIFQENVSQKSNKVNRGPSVLNCPQTDTEDDHPILRREVELQYSHWRKGSQLESTLSQQNWSKHDNLQQDLADRRMANPMDPVLRHHTSQKRQPAAVPELLNNQSHQSSKQSHAEDHTEQIEAMNGEDHHWRIGTLQSRKGNHREDLQPMHSMWEISPAPARPLPCLHRLQEGLRQGLACSSVGNHEDVQHQHKPYPSHQKPL